MPGDWETALPEDRMPEAEVSLRLAFHLVARYEACEEVWVSIDGAHVRVKDDEIFPLVQFLKDAGWELTRQEGGNPWQGHYESNGSVLHIRTLPGVGDVVASIGERRVRAECKGGPLINRKGNPEYPILRQLLGHLLTVKSINPGDAMIAVVPDTAKFRALREKWGRAPLIQRCGIGIVLVGRNGLVDGLQL